MVPELTWQQRRRRYLIPLATERTKNNRDEQKWTGSEWNGREERERKEERMPMMVETALLLMIAVGIGLLIGLMVYAVRGDLDGVTLCGVALLTGMSTVLGLICAIVLAVVCGARGDARKAIYAIGGFLLGLVLWVGVVALLSAGLMAET